MTVRVSTVLPALLALLLASSCGLLPGAAEPGTAPQARTSPSPGSDLPVFDAMVREHMAAQWQTETEYGGRCEALSADQQLSLGQDQGVCAALFGPWEDDVVFVIGPPASEPFEGIRAATPDGVRWELRESFVIEDPYAPGPDWLDGATRVKDDPAQWEISAPTMREVAETWLADRYLPLDCEHGDGDYADRDSWCPQVEFPDHQDNPPPDGRSSMLLTHNGEPRYRLVMNSSGDTWSFTEAVATETAGHGHDEEDGQPE